MPSMIIRAVTATTLSLLVLLGGASPPTPGRIRAPGFRLDAPCQDADCPLRRIGLHLVRGDSLTGAGVPAPLFVPELRASAAHC
jgi:hypothetical protein